MDITNLKKYIIGLLSDGASPHLHYHSVFHTLDVLFAVERMMDHFEIEVHTYQIVQAAALLHETGMLTDYAGHELASVEMAKKLCPEFGFNALDIDQVVRHIMATKMPQQPKSITEEMLCDADLDYLGRADYQIVSHKLRLEWIELQGYPESLKVWYQDQVDFLGKHQYFTHLAQSQREQGKLRNLSLIKALLAGTDHNNI